MTQKKPDQASKQPLRDIFQRAIRIKAGENGNLTHLLHFAITATPSPRLYPQFTEHVSKNIYRPLPYFSQSKLKHLIEVVNHVI